MNFGFLTEDVKIPIRKLLAVTLIFSSTLAWFYLFHAYLLDEIFVGFEISWLYFGKALFYISIVASAIIGSLTSERIHRRKFLWIWIAFGVLTTASLAVFQGLAFSLFFSVILGASFGLGFPSCEAFLADSTVIEERARVSGIMIFVTFAIVFITILGSSLLNLAMIELILLAIILRSSSFFALLIDPCPREEGKIKSWQTILTSKDFALYLAPWLIFNVANGLMNVVRLPQSPDYAWASRIGQVFLYAGTSIIALLSGVIADRLGRKQPIIIGLVMLGGSYALLGFYLSPQTWLVVMATSGIAWGFIIVSYAVTVLGDLASPGSKEKFYALGGIIPLIIYMSFSGVSNLLNINVPANAISSVLCIALFISVIPVWRASETLPETKMRARRLKEHVEKVGKLVQESKKD